MNTLALLIIECQGHEVNIFKGVSGNRINEEDNIIFSDNSDPSVKKS
jgi:hypothetical protein